MVRSVCLAVGLLCSAAGCVDAVEPPSVDPSEQVDPAAFIGSWDVYAESARDVVLGTRAVITHTESYSYELGVVGGDGWVTGTLQLSRGPQLILAAFKSHGDDMWWLAGVLTDELGSGVLEVVGPSYDVFSEAVSSGPLAGTVQLLGWYDNQTKAVDVMSSGEELRVFLADEWGAPRFGNTEYWLERMQTRVRCRRPVATRSGPIGGHWRLESSLQWLLQSVQQQS